MECGCEERSVSAELQNVISGKVRKLLDVSVLFCGLVGFSLKKNLKLRAVLSKGEGKHAACLELLHLSSGKGELSFPVSSIVAVNTQIFMEYLHYKSYFFPLNYFIADRLCGIRSGLTSNC